MVVANVNRALRWAALSCLLGIALHSSPALRAQQQPGVDGAEAKWEVLERCRLVTNSIVDGDSFRVQRWGRSSRLLESEQGLVANSKLPCCCS